MGIAHPFDKLVHPGADRPRDELVQSDTLQIGDRQHGRAPGSEPLREQRVRLLGNDLDGLWIHDVRVVDDAEHRCCKQLVIRVQHPIQIGLDNTGIERVAIVEGDSAPELEFPGDVGPVPREPIKDGEHRHIILERCITVVRVQGGRVGDLRDDQLRG